jgi:hypothetical protein
MYVYELKSTPGSVDIQRPDKDEILHYSKALFDRAFCPGRAGLGS